MVSHIDDTFLREPEEEKLVTRILEGITCDARTQRHNPAPQGASPCQKLRHFTSHHPPSQKRTGEHTARRGSFASGDLLNADEARDRRGLSRPPGWFMYVRYRIPPGIVHSN